MIKDIIDGVIEERTSPTKLVSLAISKKEMDSVQLEELIDLITRLMLSESLNEWAKESDSAHRTNQEKYLKESIRAFDKFKAEFLSPPM